MTVVVPRWLLPAQLAALDGRPADRRTVRDWAADAGLFALAAIVAVEQARALPQAGADFVHGWQVAANPWVAAVACLSLWWRRRWPTALAVATVPALAISASATGAAMVAALTVAVHRPWPRAAAVTCAYLLVVSYYAAFGGPPNVARPVVAGTLLLMFAGPFCVGTAVRARRLLVAGLRREAEVTRREHRLELEEARRAEREHRLRLVEARRAERERLAREMHDVLAHRVSLLSVHAGALAYRTAQAAAGTGPPLDAAEVGGAVEVIQDNARRALDELRDVLSVLRDGEPGTDPPQPGLRDLPRLVAEAEAAGQRVVLAAGDVIERAGSVRAHVQRTAYRTVQEGLTNARKHAPSAEVTVRVAGTPGAELVITVENPLPKAPRPVPSAAGPGAGNGLIGLAERAALDGGRLKYGPHDGAFRLSARLPWQT